MNHHLLTRSPGDAFDLAGRNTGCVAYNSKAKEPTYGYDPSLVAGIIFSVVFGLTMSAHILQTIKYRKWWYLSFAIGALCELIGWAARAAAYGCPYSKTLFSLQISILIIGKISDHSSSSPRSNLFCSTLLLLCRYLLPARRAHQTIRPPILTNLPPRLPDPLYRLRHHLHRHSRHRRRLSVLRRRQDPPS